MRVLHFLPWHSPRTKGGTESFLLQLGKLQQKRGDDVRIIAPNASREAGHDIIDGIPVTYFPPGRPLAATRFHEMVEAIAPEVIHLHGLDYVFRDFFRFAAEKGTPRLVMTLHLVNVVSPDGMRDSARRSLMELAAIRADRFFRATGLVSLLSKLARYPPASVNQALLMDFLRTSVILDVLSPWYMDVLFRKGFSAARIRLRPNPMHVPGMFRPLPAEPVRNRPMRFLFVGRLSADKGVATIVKALKQLTDLRDRFTVEFVGREVDEGLLDQIRNLSAWNMGVSCAGEVPQEDVGRHMESADYLLFPSIKAEMAPLVIQEALSRGRAVIASDHPSSAAYISNGLNGFLYNAGSSSALADLMRHLIEERTRLHFSVAMPPDYDDILYRHYSDLYAGRQDPHAEFG